MGIRRLARLLAARAWLVGLMGLAGAVGASIWAVHHNRGVRPLFEGVAVVTFAADDNDRDKASVIGLLTEAAATARSANVSLITDGLGLVNVDERAGQLSMATRADKEADAVALAGQMREAYFQLAFEEAEAVADQRLDAIVAEVTTLLDRLDTLRPDDSAPTISPADQARLDFLNSQVAALTQRSAQLSVDQIVAASGNDRAGTPEEIQTELELIATRLGELYAEIADITAATGAVSNRSTNTVESSEPSEPRAADGTDQSASSQDLEGTWTIEAIEARLGELEVEYESLFVTRGFTDVEQPVLTPVTVTDLTPPRYPPFLVGSGGLLGAVILAMGVAYIEDRARQRLFVEADMPAPRLLAELPSWRSTMHGSQKHRTRLGARRTAAVQSLRQPVIGLLGRADKPPVLGLAGARVDHGEVEALALDLALSIAATDRTILVLDFDFKAEPAMIADGNGLTVAEILNRLRHANGKVGLSELKRAFHDAVPVATGLRMISSGNPDDLPAHIVLTNSFEQLLSGARDQADLVIAISPPLSDPEFAAVADQLDGVVSVARLAKTRKSDMREVAASGQLSGWVLLNRWKRPVGRRRHLNSILLRRTRLERGHGLVESGDSLAINTNRISEVLDSARKKTRALPKPNRGQTEGLKADQAADESNGAGSLEVVGESKTD